jgi:hypothetical protein
MALELVEYESVSAAIDVLLVSRQPANMITSGGTNIITIPNMYSPQQPTAPAQAVANYGRISIPVLGEWVGSTYHILWKRYCRQQ